jgi:hypothetical protein
MKHASWIRHGNSNACPSFTPAKTGRFEQEQTEATEEILSSLCDLLFNLFSSRARCDLIEFTELIDRGANRHRRPSRKTHVAEPATV